MAQEVADLLGGRARAAIERLDRIVAGGVDRDATNAARVLLDQMVKHRDAVFVADRLAEAEAQIRAGWAAAARNGMVAIPVPPAALGAAEVPGR